MKTPTNIAGNNLATWLQTATEIRMADLYTIVLTSGTVLRYTTWDSPIVFGNLLKFSEQFDQWTDGTASGVALPVVTANSQLAPDGISLTADTISCPATVGQWSLIGQSFLSLPAVAGKTFTLSIWLRAATSVTVSLLVEDSGGHTAIFVNQPINTTWQRYVFSGTYSSLGSLVGSPSVFIGLDGTFPATTFFAWGAQLTQSSAPTAYVPTAAGAIGGGTFMTGPPDIARTAIEEKIGLDVSTIELTLTAGSGDLLTGTNIPILQAIGLGYLDGASCRIDRLFMDAAGNQIGSVNRFAGYVGPVEELMRNSAKLTVNSGTQLLTMQLPYVILQPNCTNTLFDARCTLSKAAFANNLVVQGGSTPNKVITLSSQPDGYFDNGQIVFASGPNAGLTKAVKQYFGKNFFFNSPLPFAPNTGDGFTAYPGCDKTQATCTTKFNNVANFEGFPYVPAPEAAI